MDTIELNGVKYRRAEPSGERMRIVIADNRGLTFVGRCNIDGDSEQIVIHDARCIIHWGTEKHLAQLVNGPTEETGLGACADVTVFRRNLVAAYDVDEEKWK
jgi:hypothetical protein